MNRVVFQTTFLAHRHRGSDTNAVGHGIRGCINA